MLTPFALTDEELMDKNFPDYTICQVLREIYHATEDEDIQVYCRLGVTMGKVMDAKLRKYKEEWSSDFWDKTDNKELSAHMPCPIENIETDYPEFTICNVLKMIYQKTNKEDIKVKCRIGITMGKAMDNALRQYKKRAKINEQH